MLGGLGAGGRSAPASIKNSVESEAAIIARVAAKDARAFEVLYRIYHPRLTRFISSIVHSPPLVDEALNDTMLVIWDRANSYNGSCKVSTWIFAIAYRKALSRLRRRDEPEEDAAALSRPCPEADPERRLDQRQTQEVLLEAMKELSADHRAVLDLTYFHEMGYREIADIMECPVDTVKTRMFHARRHLKKRLAGELADWL